MKREHWMILSLAVLTAGCGPKKDAVALDDSPNTRINVTPTQVERGEPSASADSASAGAGWKKSNAGGGRLAALSSMSASTEAQRKATLAPRVSDVIRQVAVEEGQRVKKGQLLIQLDGADYRLGLEQAQAARDTAQAQLEAARVEWQRLKRLVQDKAVPRSQFESLDAQMAVHRAALSQAEVGVKQARQRLQYTRVAAPFTGVVTQIMVEAGEHVTTMPPSRLLTLEQIDTLKLRIKAPDPAMDQLRAGAKIRVSFPANGKMRQTTVERVIPSLSRGTRELSALAVLDNKDGAFLPGMFANVTVVEKAPASRTPDKAPGTKTAAVSGKEQ